jgi:hypothetical protein
MRIGSAASRFDEDGRMASRFDEDGKRGEQIR